MLICTSLSKNCRQNLSGFPSSVGLEGHRATNPVAGSNTPEPLPISTEHRLCVLPRQQHKGRGVELKRYHGINS